MQWLKITFRRKFFAFSLLEAMLAMSVIGIALGCVFPLIKTFSAANKIRKNEEHFQYIRIAMQAYLLRHGHLPFAAKDTHGLAKENFINGHVPYKTLGIRKKYIYDANNEPFKFVVNGNLVPQPGRIFLPITFPHTTVIDGHYVTFGRLYKYDETLTTNSDDLSYDGTKIVKYDDIDESKNIEILENGKSVIDENDVIFIMPPIRKFFSYSSLFRWTFDYVSTVMHDEKYKTRNLVAWTLISYKKRDVALKNSQSLKFNLESGQIFYQTRFDMAAQINFPCTVEPVYSKLKSTSDIESKRSRIALIAKHGPENNNPFILPIPPLAERQRIERQEINARLNPDPNQHFTVHK